MPAMSRSWPCAALALFASFGVRSEVARAGNCTTLEVALQPAEAADSDNRSPVQIVMWIEDASGTYRDTAFITDAVGRHGIGNRPGRFDFNSGPRWPYGRRITTFPVWAHRHGIMFPEVVFQNDVDHQLSHPMAQSSPDSLFCRPMQRVEASWDTATCASIGYTDKGKFAGEDRSSRYPPRQGIVRMAQDDAAVDMFDMVNPFDVVSQPTPPTGQLSRLSYALPEDLGPGEYTLWIEVAKEFDLNGTYNASTYPPPDVPWEAYGLPYRGQPSVLYKMDFALDAELETTAHTVEYVGYGDPDGLDGNVRPPDSTITSNTPGSGSSRLALIAEGDTMYRAKLVARPELDVTAPGPASDLGVVALGSSTVTLGFVAPGDDGEVGTARRYEIRIRAGEPITDGNFAQSQLVGTVVVPAEAGTYQELRLERLLWETTYSVAIQAVDNCQNVSPLAVTTFTTNERALGEVDACVIATAAYGSTLANELEPLRRVRDELVRRTIFGELAVEAYYTFGPAVSGAIGESDVLRATTREALAPIVRAAKGVLP